MEDFEFNDATNIPGSENQDLSVSRNDLETHRNLSRMCDLANVNVGYSFHDTFVDDENVSFLPVGEGEHFDQSFRNIGTENKPAERALYHGSIERGGPRVDVSRKQRESTQTISSYFDTFSVVENGKLVEKSRCKMEGCNIEFLGTKTRNQKYHIICCPKVPLSVRKHYHDRSNAKDKPPLLVNPPLNCTVQQVRNYAKNMHDQSMNAFCSNLINPVLWNSDTIFSAFRNAPGLTTATGTGNDVSETEQEIFNLLLTRMIVNNSLPFSFVDKKKHEEISGIAQIFKFIRPGITLPSSSKIKKKLIPQYYELVRGRVTHELKSALAEGFATLMFDSSEDVNQSPVTHFLVRVMVGPRLSIKTFFLASTYSGTSRTTADYYRDRAFEVIGKWFDIRRLVGVVTDNTSNVKNAREFIMNNTYGVVASQDQAHVADRLMEDIGEIAWISETLDAIVSVSVYIRRFRKVKEKVNQLIQAHVAREKEARRNISSFPVTDELFRAQLGLEPEEQDLSSIGSSLMVLGEEGYSSLQSVVNSLSDENVEHRAHAETEEHEDENVEQRGPGGQSGNYFAPQLRGRPKHIKKLSKVRFASAEKLLLEFRSLLPVLRVLVEDPKFDQLFSCNSESDKRERFEDLIFPVSDRFLEKKSEQAHAILHACRMYLRIFDGEAALVSEVFHATVILEAILTRLPLDNFPEPKTQNRDHLLAVFNNRKQGGVSGMRKVKITLLSDLHYSASLMDPNRCPAVIEDLHRSALRRHITSFLAGGSVNTMGLSITRFVDFMMSEYEEIRCAWRDEQLLNPDLTSTGHTGEMRKRYRSNPLIHWISGRGSLHEDPIQRRAHEELRNYAKRVLCVSPTATATERSFSHLNRIHSQQRSRMQRETIETLMFCQWNERVLNENLTYPWISGKKIVEDQISSLVALRNLKKKVTKLISNLPPYPTENQLRAANRTAYRIAAEEVRSNPAITRRTQTSQEDSITVETTSGAQPESHIQPAQERAPSNAGLPVQESSPQHFFAQTPAPLPATSMFTMPVAPQSGAIFPQLLPSAGSTQTGAWVQGPVFLTPQPIMQTGPSSTGLSAMNFSIGIPQSVGQNSLSPSQMVYVGNQLNPSVNTTSVQRGQAHREPVRKRSRHERN